MPEKTYTITLTEEKYRSLLEFLARGVDDLAHYVKEYGDEYAAEDRIDEVVQSGYDLIAELPDL